MANPRHADHIEALDSSSDDARSEADSGFGEGALSTASLQSSIFAYEEEYGRTYHAFRAAKNEYVMPNDEREQERQDIHYHSLRLTLEGKAFLAPVEQLDAILDIGTGTGIWAMDVADDHPETSVIGVDISPIQPTAVPPNLEYQIMDADEPWDFSDRFDLVHTRFMNGFSVKSWPHFYEQAFESLRPGGWVENQEFDLKFTSDDGTQKADGAANRWMDLWNEGVGRFGGNLTGRCYPDLMVQQMQATGFTNCTIRPYKMPIGVWPKDKRLREAGLYSMYGMVDGVSGLSQRVFTKGLGWTIEEMEVLLMEVRQEWQNKRVHSYIPVYVVCGQKPW